MIAPRLTPIEDVEGEVPDWGAGVRIKSQFAFENIVAGNRIGTTADGSAALNMSSEPGGVGVLVLGSDDNVIGGLDTGVYIMQNGDLLAKENRIIGNLIGTNAEGTAPPPTSAGVNLIGLAPATAIGDNAAGTRNVIFGSSAGIFIADGLSEDGLPVEGPIGSSTVNNLIGLDVTGTYALGDNLVGISVGGEVTLVYNAIGTGFGEQFGEPLPNTRDGVHVYDGVLLAGEYNSALALNVLANHIVLNGRQGIAADPEAIVGIGANLISGNGGLGIDIGVNGTSEDLLVRPVVPVVQFAETEGGTEVRAQVILPEEVASGGELLGTDLFVYASNVCDPSGFGEWEIFEMQLPSQTTGGTVDIVFSPENLFFGSFITMVAIQVNELG